MHTEFKLIRAVVNNPITVGSFSMTLPDGGSLPEKDAAS